MKNLTTITLIGFTLQALAQPPAENLVAHFPFDGNATDLVEGLYPSDTTGEHSFCEGRFGGEDSAVCFDASSFLSYGDTLDMYTQDFAVSFWFNVDTITGVGYNTGSRLVNKGGTIDGTPQNGGWGTLFQQVDTGQFTFEFFTNDGASVPVDSIEVPITLDQWHHMVYQRCGTTHNMFLDCEFVGSFDTIAGLNLDVNTWFALGALDRRPGAQTSSGYFDGALDELRVYRGGCLVEEEVWALCSEGLENHGSTTRDAGLLQIVPNPARDWIYVANPNGLSATLIVRDGAGRRMQEPFAITTATQPIQVSVADLDPGAYFVTLQGDQWQSHGRFIKE